MMNWETDHIITYMGNKRKIVPHIEEIVIAIKARMGKDKISIGEGFSGSGVVSRMFKKHADKLYVNDIAGYSNTLNKCYLTNPDNEMRALITEHIIQANKVINENKSESECDKYIQGNWSPSNEVITKDDRVYFTKENGRRIDEYRAYINKLPGIIMPFLLAPLLVEASKHNNCSGNFAAYYKKDGIGCFGGKNGIDVKRITQNIELIEPQFLINGCEVFIEKEDVSEWIAKTPKMDLVYYDPPYNKHPYHIYYFMLDIINNWDVDIKIPKTFRGQPKQWTQSAYNSYTKASSEFETLIKNTNAKFILVSYNNEGIINEADMKTILGKYGVVSETNINHNIYNRMRGIAKYKKVSSTGDCDGKDDKDDKVKESLYLLEKI